MSNETKKPKYTYDGKEVQPVPVSAVTYDLSARKPWEETWEFGAHGGPVIWLRPGGREGPVGTIHDEARGKLAGQAPAMARLLLTLRVLHGPTAGLPDSRLDEVLRAAGVLP